MYKKHEKCLHRISKYECWMIFHVLKSSSPVVWKQRKENSELRTPLWSYGLLLFTFVGGDSATAKRDSHAHNLTAIHFTRNYFVGSLHHVECVCVAQIRTRMLFSSKNPRDTNKRAYEEGPSPFPFATTGRQLRSLFACVSVLLLPWLANQDFSPAEPEKKARHSFFLPRMYRGKCRNPASRVKFGQTEGSLSRNTTFRYQ